MSSVKYAFECTNMRLSKFSVDSVTGTFTRISEKCSIQAGELMKTEVRIISIVISIALVCFLPLLLMLFIRRVRVSIEVLGKKKWYKDTVLYMHIKAILIWFFDLMMVVDPYGVNATFGQFGFSVFYALGGFCVISGAYSIVFLWYSSLSSIYSWKYTKIKFWRAVVESENIIFTIVGLIPPKSREFALFQATMFLFRGIFVALVNAGFGLPLAIAARENSKTLEEKKLSSNKLFVVTLVPAVSVSILVSLMIWIRVKAFHSDPTEDLKTISQIKTQILVEFVLFQGAVLVIISSFLFTFWKKRSHVDMSKTGKFESDIKTSPSTRTSRHRKHRTRSLPSPETQLESPTAPVPDFSPISAAPSIPEVGLQTGNQENL